MKQDCSDNFQKKLYNIYEQLNKVTAKDELFYNCVKEKLNNSLSYYMNELNINYKYLLERDCLKVIKNINKMK